MFYDLLLQPPPALMIWRKLKYQSYIFLSSYSTFVVFEKCNYNILPQQGIKEQDFALIFSMKLHNLKNSILTGAVTKMTLMALGVVHLMQLQILQLI